MSIQNKTNTTSIPSPTTQLYIPIPSSSSVSKRFSAEKKGWITYENYISGYAIDFPESLHFYESNYNVTFWEGSIQGSICLTESKVNYETDKCSTGLLIYYSTPYINGKGGMGCGKDQTQLQLRDTITYTCMDELHMGSAGINYVKHPSINSELGFTATFSAKNTKRNVLEILKTFRFIKK